MHSPFPGMDPFIEQPEIWTDFHGNLAAAIQSRLNDVLQPQYYAGLSSYITYEVIDIHLAHPAGRRGVRPDMDVWKSIAESAAPGATAATFSPATVRTTVPFDVPLELFSVEVRAAGDRQLVTAIEILSPVNKSPGHPAHDDYLRKRRDLLHATVHLVEIDLLRAGRRPPLTPPVPPAPYYVMLSRAEARPTVEVWPIQLADALPVLPVPLLAPDPDVPLDLGAAVRSVYRHGRYGMRIDYNEPPPPPLDRKTAAWIESRLREHEA